MKAIEQKSERIVTRVTPSQKAFIARANAIEEAHMIQLLQEDQVKLAKVLMNPAEPNNALKKAADAYDEATINSQ